MGLSAVIAPLCIQLLANAAGQASHGGRINVLYIIVDDLRPQLGVYGQSHTGVSSPNIDALGRQGTVFTRAYAQQAICGPSRNSFLSGRRPDRTRVWTFTTHFRQAPGGDTWQSLPQLFKEGGHVTCGLGKTFHDEIWLGPPLYDMAYSWSPECTCPEDDVTSGEGGWLPFADDKGHPTNSTCVSGYYSPFVDGCPEVGPHCTPEQHQREFTDSKTASAAIAALHRFHAGTKPFFLMVGFRRPHLAWAIPARYLEDVPRNVSVAKHKTAPRGMPEVAFFSGNDEGYMNRAASGLMMLPDTPLDDAVAREIRRGYYAAVRFVDTEIGRVLDALESLSLSANTAVVLHGDHGWQLGEHGSWSKETNFELATRVPLIVRAPWIADSEGVVASEPLVSLIDVYRSLAELAGLTPAPDVEGTSFVAHLTSRRAASLAPDLEGGAFSAAFSQYPRPGTCAEMEPKDIDDMGFSVRTARWRYTEWKPWNKTALAPVWESRVHGSELYAHAGDDGTDMDAFENENVVDTDEGRRVAPALAEMLRQHFAPEPTVASVV